VGSCAIGLGSTRSLGWEEAISTILKILHSWGTSEARENGRLVDSSARTGAPGQLGVDIFGRAFFGETPHVRHFCRYTYRETALEDFCLVGIPGDLPGSNRVSVHTCTVHRDLPPFVLNPRIEFHIFA
jgi:hypothetical protein